MKLKITLITAALFLSGCGENYSDGFRVGEIQKASYKGILFKSYEGELVQTGFRNKNKADGSSTLSNTWLFSATDPAIIKKLDESAGKNVRVYYHQWLIQPPTQNSPYTVYKIEEVK